MTSPVAFDDFARLVQDRRTSMFVDQARPVPPEIVEQLCELVTWAPNHKKTWPWRFAVFTDHGRARLGETMVADMIEADFGDEGKRLKTRTKYLRTPAVLVVGATAARQRDARPRESRRRRRRRPEPAARGDLDRARQLLVDARAHAARRASSNCAASTPPTASSR